MRLGVPKESTPGERRVALVPETVGRLPDGVDVVVEADAGAAASFGDDDYREAGASIGDPWEAELVAKVACADRRRGRHGSAPGQALIAFLGR